MTTHLPAALLPLLLALVQGLLLWALWSLRRSFVPQAEHLRCRRDEQRREALWLRRLDLLEQALAQERELLTPLADEVRSLREDAGRLRSQLQAQEARFYGLERLLQRLERHLERQEDRWQQLPGAALPAARPPLRQAAGPGCRKAAPGSCRHSLPRFAAAGRRVVVLCSIVALCLPPACPARPAAWLENGLAPPFAPCPLPCPTALGKAHISARCTGCSARAARTRFHRFG